MEPVVILNQQRFEITVKRLCYQLIENHGNFSNSVILGLQPRGVFLANRLKKVLKEVSGVEVQTGALDITFYRDDFRRKDKPLIPSVTNLDFSVEGKRVIIVDDVLYTGRTVRAGMEACLTWGRPSEIELMAFIDRRFQRNIPIQPDYIGKSVDTIDEEMVVVNWEETEGEDIVLLKRKSSEQ
ncbi:bifunctional pyr operon transcriptional regulator/uracil phosphoribosyltransferase PyrR [Parvicella tangerina]|uniref:Bifunctional protein PyrR n=1 Tax=Parvicella tangerina TaxID=2829795 RepID=A0A916NAD0_9FLAO|nr:bifunctional pyr operon transcriptional regulator/uracil phosphoribosyltransferase PyrR [Parvicella tangerina]CAG5080514.1 Bifunctional protein PyrR [Parvicella tangerina]